MSAFRRKTLPLLALLLGGVHAHGIVIPAALFTDGAILQRDKRVPIWGKADPGEKVAVAFAGQRIETTTGSDGRWLVYLEPLAIAQQGSELTITGKNRIAVRDIVVGDVWLCAGQSNMEWPVVRSADAVREIAGGNFPLLRHLRIAQTVSEVPGDSLQTGGAGNGAGWQAATPLTVGNFTAVGYFFARDLHQKTGVPIGLIHASWGGTPIEAWLSPAALAGNPAFAVVHERWRRAVAEFPALFPPYEKKLSAWVQAEREAKSRGGPAYDAFLRQNPRPRPPRGGKGDPWTPAGLFNGMVNPLLPCALRGVLWYQGESNADRATEYRALFSALINAWRAHFGQEDLPFFWVNLANYAVVADGGEKGRAFAFLREAQTKTLALPHTGQAIAIDIGDPKDIHPLNKQEVGRRLALLARNRVYGMVGDDTGPTFESAVREGSALRVHFTHTSNGLVARDRPVQSLELAGADRVFHPAIGRIERDTLIVSSPAVREPVAVRYAWTNAPIANLYNGAGLPAVPFRSDEW